MKHHPAAAGSLAAAVLAGLLVGVGYPSSQNTFEQVHHLQEVAQQRPFTNAEVDQLVVLASDNDGMVRMRALTALRHVSTPVQKGKAVNAMREALADREYPVRAYAVTGLSLVGDISAIPTLKPLLNDSEPNVRNIAGRAIGKLYLAAGETEKAISSYEAAVHVADVDSDLLTPTVRELVAACRKAARPAEAVSFLQRLLASEPTNHAYMEMLALAYEGAGQPGKAAVWHRRSEAVGDRAHIPLKDLYGEERTLSAYRGKLVLLNFFASW